MTYREAIYFLNGLKWHKFEYTDRIKIDDGTDYVVDCRRKSDGLMSYPNRSKVVALATKLKENLNAIRD